MELAKYLSLSEKELGDIYASIAVTYSDCKEYHKALEFYQMELDSRQNEYKEVCGDIHKSMSNCRAFLYVFSESNFSYVIFCEIIC